MNTKPPSALRLGQVISLALCLSASAFAAPTPSVLDDFSQPDATSRGTPRLTITDSSVGGGSHLEQRVAGGVLIATGEIVPPRGQPGWASLAFLLTPTGAAADLSRYTGIRLKVRMSRGFLSVSANSSEVDNFDYHAATVEPKPGEEFREVRIPFKNMRRAWSAQTKLNPTTITGISLVAVGLQKGKFSYAVDELGFY